MVLVLDQRNNIMTRRISIVFIICSLVCLSQTAVASFHHKKSTQPPAPIHVEVTNVTQMDIPRYVYSVGSLVAMESVEISSEVDGRVKHIAFKDGQFVSKGSLILQLDDAEAQAALTQAETAAKLSQTTYQRYLAISKEAGGGAVSQQTLDQRRADMESKQAAVASAKATLAEKSMTAPFSGRLSAFQVTEGNYIKAGDPLVTLVNKRMLQVKYTIPEKYLPKLKLGQEVDVTIGTFPDQVFKGSVSFVSPQVDVDTRTVHLKATIPNPDEKLSPGMFVHVGQLLSIDKQALVIPEEAIVPGLAGDTVFVIKENKAYVSKIKVGVRMQGKAQVLTGLQLSDVVVRAGQQKLQDGAAVKVVNGQSRSE